MLSLQQNLALACALLLRMNVQHAIETPNMFAPVSTPAFAIGDWPKEEFKLYGITLIDGPKEESAEKSITYSEMLPFFAPRPRSRRSRNGTGPHSRECGETRSDARAEL